MFMQTLEKLEKSVQAGNYYEAQQMYKTIYARQLIYPVDFSFVALANWN